MNALNASSAMGSGSFYLVLSLYGIEGGRDPAFEHPTESLATTQSFRAPRM